MLRVAPAFLLLGVALSSPPVAFSQHPPTVHPEEPYGGCEGNIATQDVVGVTDSQARVVATPLRARPAEHVSVASDPAGGRVIVGSFQRETQIGSHVETQMGMGAFIACMNSVGEVRWSRSWATNGNDWVAPVVAVAPNGMVVVAALTGASAITLEGSTVPEASAFVARWTSAGAFLGVSVVARRFSGSMHRGALAVAVDANASVTLAGSLESGAAVVHVRPDGTIRRIKVHTELPREVAVSEDGSSAFAFDRPDLTQWPDATHLIRVAVDASLTTDVVFEGTVDSLSVGEDLTVVLVRSQNWNGTKVSAWSAGGVLVWELAERMLDRLAVSAVVHRGNVYVARLNDSADGPFRVNRVSPTGQETELVQFELAYPNNPSVAQFVSSGSQLHLAWAAIPYLHPHCSVVPPPDWTTVDLSPVIR